MSLRHLPFVVLLAIASGVIAGHADAAGPAMTLGVAEDAVRAPDLPTAEAKMAQLRLAGFTAVRVTTNWEPGLVAPTADELRELRNVATAADLNGVEVYVSVYNAGQRTTPLDATAQSQFAQYAASVARLRAELRPDHRRQRAEPEPLLAPAVRARRLERLGARLPLAPGADLRRPEGRRPDDHRVGRRAGAPRKRPADGIRPTSSPTAFIQAIGTAYRASGRTLPVMDGLALHPYPDNSSQSPDFPHPRSTSIGLADYGKLVALLGQAFDGTAQAGSSLPILYDEFGIESAVPEGKRSLYSGTEPATTKPVDERQQAASYDLGLRLAFCQPTVEGILLFHSQDETALPSWQSGVYYADGTPKSSFWAVRDSLARTRGGSIAHCDGMALEVSPLGVRFPGPRAFQRGVHSVRFRCSLDCAWTLEALRSTTGALAARVNGYGRGDTTLVASFGKTKLGKAPVRLRLTLVHPVNPGAPESVTSGLLRPA